MLVSIIPATDLQACEEHRAEVAGFKAKSRIYIMNFMVTCINASYPPDILV
jgi:hypothetical protein